MTDVIGPQRSESSNNSDWSHALCTEGVSSHLSLFPALTIYSTPFSPHVYYIQLPQKKDQQIKKKAAQQVERRNNKVKS